MVMGLRRFTTPARVHAVAGAGFDYPGVFTACACSFSGFLRVRFQAATRGFGEFRTGDGHGCRGAGDALFTGFGLGRARFTLGAGFPALSNGCHV